MRSNTGSWLIAGLEGAQAYDGIGRFDPGWFHPSAFGNDCDAFLAFNFLGAPAVQSISANTQRIFDLGNARDIQLKADMQKSGLSIIKKESERKIEIPSLHIRGELDDLVQNPINKKRYVIDYKTMRPEEYEALKEVKREHHLQLHPYMYAKQVYEGFVLYENKGNQNLKLKPANFDGTIWQEKIVERVEKILAWLEKDFVNRNPTSCSRCPFFANGVCTMNKIAQLKEASGLWNS